MTLSPEDLETLSEITGASVWSFRRIWNDVRVGPWIEISGADVGTERLEDLERFLTICLEQPPALVQTGLGMTMYEDVTKQYQYVRASELRRFKRGNGFV